MGASTRTTCSKTRSPPPKTTRRRLSLLVVDDDYYRTATIQVHSGERYPHLVRDDIKPDYLGDLIKPRVGGQ